MRKIRALFLLKEAGLTALVAFVLALPLIGFKTITGGGRLEFVFRWEVLLATVSIIFFGRLTLAAVRDTWGKKGSVSTRFIRLSENIKKRRLFLTILIIAAALVFPFMPEVDRRLVDLATLVLIYVMLGWGLNIVVGLAGLLDLGYVAFYAVGAYTFALLGTVYDWSFWTCLPIAGAVAAMFGILLGYPVLRLRGDYLAIVTLGFGEIIRIILTNWVALSGGPNGIAGIPRPTLFGLEFTRRTREGHSFHEYFDLPFSGDYRIIYLYYVILILALITNLFVVKIRKLPIGRAWEALREDEIACRALGINPVNVKLSAFALGAMFGGFAGSFFASRNGFISPESFTFIESAIILAIVVLGGMGSQVGVVLAAAAIVLLPEALRDFSEYRMLVFGMAMVLVMVWRPRGLLANREPTITLNSNGRV
ncbi:MAG: branched-chain amino acid ABC transporter permease [Rhodospirillaceae bacterium]|nr:branched-chain amino acid ABC transporter permease [Rhodospirillaceae bacterium]